MNKIEIYTKSTCAFCKRAKALLDSLDLAYQETEITRNQAKRAEMIARSGRFTVPQIFIDGQSIGGSDDLAQLAKSEQLQKLIDNKVDSRAYSHTSIIGGEVHV